MALALLKEGWSLRESQKDESLSFFFLFLLLFFFLFLFVSSAFSLCYSEK